VGIAIVVVVLALLVYVAGRYRRQLLGFGQQVKVFLQEVYVELRKSSWPSWIELRDSTLVVVFAVIALALFVGVFDWLIVMIISWMTRG